MSDSPPQDELAGSEQPFVQHLVELRDRLIKACIAIGVAAVALSIFPGPASLYDILAAPLIAQLPSGATLIATSVISPFLVPLKILLMTAFLLALPVVLYQMWAFVAPGLYNHEKKLVLPLIVSSTLLFFTGVAFCYFFVFGKVFAFIQSFAPKSITAAPDIEAYLSFVITMFIAFGLAFEVPIVVVVLARMGIVSVEKLREFRSYFIVVAFISHTATCRVVECCRTRSFWPSASKSPTPTTFQSGSLTPDGVNSFTAVMVVSCMYQAASCPVACCCHTRSG